jgi:hypothetical protein
MTHRKKLSLGLLALALGNLSFIAAFALHFAFPFASLEFTRGFFMGFAIIMNAIAVVLLITAAHAQRCQSSSVAPGAK